MKLLATIKEQDINPSAVLSDTGKYNTPEASRAVLVGPTGEVFLLNVSLHHYHKLPGGGIDTGEDIQTALMRELMEEVGCKAEVITEIGMIVEYRDYEKLKQTSHCFLAKQVGEQIESSLEEGELAEGMIEVRAKGINEAIELLEDDNPNNLEGEFIKCRDLLFLKTAQALLDK